MPAAKKTENQEAAEAAKSAEQKQAEKERVSKLAQEVLSGLHGVGDVRKKSLGKYNDDVMKEVHRVRLQGVKK